MEGQAVVDLVGENAAKDYNDGRGTLAWVAARPEVEYLVATAGRYDLMFEVIVESEQHLLELLSTLRSRADVIEVEAFPCLKLYKQTFAWGA
jgi:hypothetical protein